MPISFGSPQYGHITIPSVSAVPSPSENSSSRLSSAKSTINLPNPFAAAATWRVELRVGQASDGAAEILRRSSDLLDAVAALGVRQRGDRCVLANRIPLVSHWSTRQLVVSSVVPHLIRRTPRS